MRLDFTANAPSDFHNTVHSHGWYQLAPTQWDEEMRVLRRPERMPDGRVVMLTISGTPGGFCVEASGRWSKANVAPLRERIALAIHAHPSLFMKHANFALASVLFCRDCVGFARAV
jgi:hypothetical protein